MTRKIRIKESVYKRATKAIETLKSAKEDVNDIQKKVWNLKNKLKQR